MKFGNLFAPQLAFCFSSVVSAGAVPFGPIAFSGPTYADLKEVLHGSSLYLSGKADGKFFFRINDMVMDTSVPAYFLSGSDLYLIDGKSGGFYKNWQFQELTFNRRIFDLQDIFVFNTNVYVAGLESDSTINTPPVPLFFQNGKLCYLPLPSANHTVIPRKIFADPNNVWIAGSSGLGPVLWRDSEFVEIIPSGKFGTRILTLAKYKDKILVSGTNGYVNQDFFVHGGWYWHEGVLHSIKYFEDGDDNNPDDYLQVKQFIVSGDSLLAVGDPPFLEAPSFIWINGVATKWVDSTVSQSRLLGIARNKGHLYLLGKYDENGKSILCLWTQGKRIVLGDPALFFDIYSFQVVDQELSGIKPAPSTNKKGNRRSRNKAERGNVYLGNLPGRPDADRSTADGKIFKQ